MSQDAGDFEESLEWARATVAAFAEAHARPRNTSTELEQLIEELVTDLLCLAEYHDISAHAIADIAWQYAERNVRDYLNEREEDDEDSEIGGDSDE